MQYESRYGPSGLLFLGRRLCVSVLCGKVELDMKMSSNSDGGTSGGEKFKIIEKLVLMQEEL